MDRQAIGNPVWEGRLEEIGDLVEQGRTNSEVTVNLKKPSRKRLADGSRDDPTITGDPRSIAFPLVPTRLSRSNRRAPGTTQVGVAETTCRPA